MKEFRLNIIRNLLWLNLYQAYADYQVVMSLTEEVIATIAQEVLGTTKITYQGQEIDLTPPWNRLTMTEAVKKYSGIDFSVIKTVEEARASSRSNCILPMNQSMVLGQL